MLNDLSGKIDPSSLKVLLEINKYAIKLNLDYFIIGATARDILLEHSHDIKSTRMTKDIDIAVCVTNWEEYKALIDELMATGRFAKHAQKQRYDYDGTSIDIIPFGDISGPDNKISWPPYHDPIMSTVGFIDIYKNAKIYRFNNKPVLDIKVPSIPGLAMLKILSWNDAYPGREKDAEDLLFIMREYQRAGIEDRLYGQETSLLEEEDFDIELAGIRLLGRDMARISSTATVKAIKEILIDETMENCKCRLAFQMEKNRDDYDAIMVLLKKLKQGFFEENDF